MKAFDLQRMALDNVPVAFLGEVALRSFTPLFWCFFS